MSEIIKIKEAPGNVCKKTCKGIEVPTRDEVEALDAMREIKRQVRWIEKEITAIPDLLENQEKKAGMEKEITRLKEKWKEWDSKREEAAKIRMMLLGHEEP